jgi:HEAT repeat protein
MLAQVTGRFYLEKETFAVGEPVFLYFEMTNSGTETQNVHRADPFSFCSGYQIHVSTDLSPNSSCGPMTAGGSCASSDAPLGPGKTRTERILLNYEHKINAPGDYEVQAEIHLPYASADLEYFKATKTSLDVRDYLRFRVDQNARPADITLEAWVELLHSPEAATRREAARTLASLAPKSLEDTLMDFANNAEFRAWAPLAFHRLNTDRSLEGLAGLLRKTEPNEDTQSARYLGESGDPKWFPLLLEVAKKHVNDGAYVYPAAESGGGQALPFLVPLLRSADHEYTRPIAISALGHTGSPAAIPILLELLRSPDFATAERALYGLRALTHRTAGGDVSNLNPQSQYPMWAKWWTREGSHAHIYKANECGEFKPLE